MADKAKIKVAAVQIAPDLDSATGTLDRVLAATAEAAGKGARLIVFPETFVPWYPYFSFIQPPMLSGAEHIHLYDNAVVVPGPVTEAVASAARRHGVVVVLGVNERDHGSLYNAQLIFDGAGLVVVDTAAGRIGALACWEHYNPLARYALMAQHEEIHVAQFPGSMVGPIFADQIEVTIRHHALESGCFVVNATGWLTEDQIARISPEEKLRKALRGGCMTAIISPEGAHVVPPLTSGEGILIADLDMALIVKRKRMMDSVGHYARPELLSLLWDDRATAPMHKSHSTPSYATAGASDETDPGLRSAAADSDRAADQRVAILRSSSR